MGRGARAFAHVWMQWSRCLHRHSSLPRDSHRLLRTHTARRLDEAAKDLLLHGPTLRAAESSSAAMQSSGPARILARAAPVMAACRRVEFSCVGSRCASAASGAAGSAADSGAPGSRPKGTAGEHYEHQSRRTVDRSLHEGLGGAILADFLAMGGGRISKVSALQPTAAADDALSRQESTEMRAAPELAARSTASDRLRHPAVAVRERRLITAALQQREPLTQDQVETPQRSAVVGVRLRAPRRVPLLFEEGYHSYKESLQAAEEGIEDEEASEKSQVQEAELQQPARAGRAPSRQGSTPRQRPKLKVLQWHREAMQKMLCRAVLFQFLQDRRQALGLTAGQHPLWFWEARRAQEHTAAGQVATLVKYLAETELHIAQGPERREKPPGSMPLFRASELLKGERRQLVQQWEASGQRLSSRSFSEDAFVRIFLDGHLSWPKVRDLIGLDAPPRAEPAGGAAGG